MKKNGELTPLGDLEVGDLFWFACRGWKVARKGREDGRIRCICIDDGGRPLLSGMLMVETV